MQGKRVDLGMICVWVGGGRVIQILVVLWAMCGLLAA